MTGPENVLPKVADVVRGREPVGKEALVGRIFSTLGLLLGRKIELARALQVIADAEGDERFRKWILAARDRVVKGEPFEADFLIFADGDKTELVSFMTKLGERGLTGPGFLFLGELFSLFDRGMNPGEFLLEVIHTAVRRGIPLVHLLELEGHYFFCGSNVVKPELSSLRDGVARLAAPVVELIRIGEETGRLADVLDDIVKQDVNRYKVHDLATAFLLFGLLVKYGLPVSKAMVPLEGTWSLEASDSLAEAMAGAPGKFSPVWVEMMRQAETAGDVSRAALKLGRLLRARIL